MEEIQLASEAAAIGERKDQEMERHEAQQHRSGVEQYIREQRAHNLVTT